MMKRKRHTACGKKKMPVASCIILLVIVLGCVFADVICKKDPSYLDLMNYTKAPNAEFWFGTDTLGRDIFSCIWHGGRVSLLIGVASTALSTVIAIVYGAISGIAGEKVDTLLMRFTEIILSIPNLLLIIFLQAIMGKATIGSISIVIGLTSWFGIAKFEKVIPTVNEMRCIRLRKENIQIGDENTMGKFFKQERGNSYYIGEVFAVDNNLIPNARRDYFNPNPSAKKFEESLHNFFYLELYNLYYYASKVRGAQKAVVNFKKKEREYNSKLQNAGFIDTEEQKAAQKEIETEKSKLEKAKREIENRKKDANANEMYNRVFTEIEKTYKTQKEEPHNVNILQNDQSDKGKKYLTQSLSKYSKREQKLITRIYNIIKMMLPKDMADMVIKKIQEELSK